MLKWPSYGMTIPAVAPSQFEFENPALEVPFGHVQLGGDPGADPEPAGGIIYLIWPGNTSGSGGAGEHWRTTSGGPCLTCCHHNPGPG